MKKNLTAILPFALFAIIAFIYLAVTSQDFFFVAQSQDMFLYDSDFFVQVAQQPGFIAAYVGSFLTQFAFQPILGIAIFVLLLTGLSILNAWAFKLPRSSYALSIIPALLIILFISLWDYGMFASRQYGNLFSPIVGLLVMSALVGLYARINNIILRYVWVALTLIIGYPLFGCYALLTALSAILMDIVVLKRLNWILTAVAVVVGIFAPIITIRMFFVRFNTDFTLEAGLPYLDFYRDPTQILPLYLSFLAMLILSVSARYIGSKNEKFSLILSSVIAVAVMACIPVYANKDSNFHTLLAIKHAYGVGEDNKVVDLCAKESRPTRSIIMYRNAELFASGQLLDRMFQYSWVSDTLQTKNDRMNTHLSASDIYQKYTFWNFSYRWAMERIVKFKPTYSDIKTMAIDAVYNQEPVLADRYLTMLEKTIYYKDWATDERRLLDPAVLKQDSLFRIHKQIINAPHGAIDNTEQCEYMLIKHFTQLFQFSEKRAVLGMAASMVNFSEEMFWRYCLLEVKLHKDIALPKHVQEAALLFALKKNNPMLLAQIENLVGRDGAVCQEFIRNQDLMTRLLAQPNQIDANTLVSICPGTFWSYYFSDSHQAIMFD